MFIVSFRTIKYALVDFAKKFLAFGCNRYGFSFGAADNKSALAFQFLTSSIAAVEEKLDVTVF